MRRRDQLTYDLGQRNQRQLPWKSLLILVAVVAVTGLLIGWTVSSGRTVLPSRTASSTQSSGAQPSSVVSVSASPTGSPGTSVSPFPSGLDAQEEVPLPDGSQQAAATFVRAWLDPVPRTRKTVLEQVAAPALAEELMLTDPANIPRAKPRGDPVLDDASTYSAQFTQTLSTGVRIEVFLVADPQARYKWLATSVEQA